MLAPMRYKTFVWPHNPRTYTITYARDTAVHKVPMGVYTMQDLGRNCRVLSGEGEFYGRDAYDIFKMLATVFYSEGPGTLIHPVWQTSTAYFTALSLRQEPREDYVAYAFTFQEGYSGYAGMTLMTQPVTRSIPSVRAERSQRGAPQTNSRVESCASSQAKPFCSRAEG